MDQTRLYLDTARIGRISPAARRAHDDFSRLAADEAGSPFFERFLCAGAGDWPEAVRARYPGLAGWRGVGPLKDLLRRLTGTCHELPVLLANRSAQLMKLAARLFFGPCRRVLVSDLCWAGYREILEDEARRTGRSVTAVPLRDGILRRGWGADEVVDAVRRVFVRSDCDGLFLSAVSNLGVRLPTAHIVSALEAIRELRFVVLDGAQELNHVPTDLGPEHCDLYLAGCHKWLGGFHPMGLGFYGKRRSRNVIDTVLANMTAEGSIDDPLLGYSGQIETGTPARRSETVSLVPLFCCHGAATDAVTAGRSVQPSALESLAELAFGSGWGPLLPARPLRTEILLVQSHRPDIRAASPATLRERFGRFGVALTAYPDGILRLSAPATEVRADDLELLRSALVI